MRMSESGSNLNTYIAIGVGLIAIAIGAYYTLGMGCNNSVAAEKTAPSQSARKSKKEESEKPKYPNGPLSIFFGSQTGTAEGFARTIMLEGRKAGYDAKTCDLEEYEPEVLANTKLAVFLMATYGEGEPTDNAQKFMKWLKNDEGETVAADFLKNMRFCVFGLGNRQYEHFNRTGKQCNEGLLRFGAQPVYKYGEGDDDGTLEEDFDAWKSELWAGLAGDNDSVAAESAKHVTDDAPEKVSLTYQVTKVTASSLKNASIRESARVTDVSGRGRSSSKTSKVPASLKHFFTSPRALVVVNRELRNQQCTKVPASEIGSTRHIEFDLHEVGLSYFTADNLAVLPENPATVVQKLGDHLDYNLDDTVDLTPIEDKESEFSIIYPTPCTVRELLTCYADILGPVRHSTLKQLVAYVSDESQQAWIQTLVHANNRHQFKEIIEEGHHSLFSLLTTSLSSCRLPLADLLHIASPLQPRYYTISSSSSYHPDHVHITVAVTETTAQSSGIHHVGLCSGFLQSLAVNQSRARVFVRPSTFRLPKSLASPVVLIGPGTGIAPMRALLQERQFLLQDKAQTTGESENEKIGDCAFFFGCKHESMDFLYREEILAFREKKNVLSELHTAFSRDGPRKVYVQHLMLDDATVGEHLVQMLIDDGGSVFVCGATAMGADVMAAFVELLKRHKSYSNEEAVAKLKKLQEKGRYVQELWSA